MEGLAKDDFLADKRTHFDINLDVVWDTVQTALPELLEKLSLARQDAGHD